MTSERRVDHNNIRTNQAFTIGLLALAFVLDSPALAAFVAAVMLISALVPPLGLFRLIYRHVLLPTGILKPQILVDNPEPHRFAQGFGSVVVALGVVAQLSGVETLGWGLVWLVIVLAGLNLTIGWCAGCTMYYWLNRLGVPGFSHSRIEASR